MKDIKNWDKIDKIIFGVNIPILFTILISMFLGYRPSMLMKIVILTYVFILFGYFMAKDRKQEKQKKRISNDSK